MKKILLIICDGLADRPIPELGNRTPLERAQTPNIDWLASKGRCGVIDVLGTGIVPTSDIAHLTLFGYDLETEYSSRGPIEALGVGFTGDQEDIALRANFCTVTSDLRITDRHAGRIENVKKLVEQVSPYTIEDVTFVLKPGSGHRSALVVSGSGLSDQISDADPMKTGLHVNLVEPLDASAEAAKTAALTNEFIKNCHRILNASKTNKFRIENKLLPANYLLVRGAGKFISVPSFRDKYEVKGCCIAGGGLYKGIGRFMGLDVVEVEGATGLPDSNIHAKIDAAMNAAVLYDFIFVHIKAADCYGEDGDFKGKKRFIEKMDSVFEKILKSDLVVALTADHATPCILKRHSEDPVPLVVWHKSISPDSVNLFSEKSCLRGSLGTIRGDMFMNLLFDKEMLQ